MTYNFMLYGALKSSRRQKRGTFTTHVYVKKYSTFPFGLYFFGEAHTHVRHVGRYIKEYLCDKVFLFAIMTFQQLLSVR